MRRWQKGFVFLLVATLVFGMLTACGSKTSDNESGDSNADEKITIRVGDCDFAVWNAQFTVAYELGYFDEEFADENVTIEVYNFANGPAGNEAFTAGEIDFFNGSGDQPFVMGVSNNVPITLLSVLNSQGRGNLIIVGADSGIDNIEDLKGKRIACGIGTQQHKSWIEKLQTVGLSEDDVELVNLTSFSEQYAAFTSGEIDAFYANTFNFNSITDGSVKSIGDFGDVPSNCYLTARTDFVEKNPEITERFIKVLKRAQDWIDENPEESYKILADKAGISVEEVKAANEATDLSIGLDDSVKQEVLDTYEFLKEQGTITVDIPAETLEKHIDGTYVSKILEE